MNPLLSTIKSDINFKSKNSGLKKKNEPLISTKKSDINYKNPVLIIDFSLL